MTKNMDQQYTIQILESSELEEIAEDDENVIELMDVIGLDVVCRICARTSDTLIPIYEAEGLEYQLETKLNKYLPFPIVKTETMPANCCHQCINTVLAWHELVEVSIEADRRLKSLQVESATVVQISEKSERDDQNETSSDGCLPQCEESKGNIMDRNENSNDACLPHSEEPKENIKCEVVKERNLSDETKLEVYLKTEKVETSQVKKENSVEDNENEDIDGESIEHFDDDTPLIERIQEQTQFICGTCDVSFQIENELVLHLVQTEHRRKRRGRQPKSRRFYCEECDYGFSVYKKMLKHQTTHIKSKNKTETQEEEKGFDQSMESMELFCSKCGFSFELLGDLQRHRRLRHPDSIVSRFKRRKCDILPQFFCDVCEKGFTRNHDMLKHRKQLHPGASECFKVNEKRTQSQANAELLSRCRIEHDGKSVYKCEHCDSIIHLSYNFIRHQTIHTGVRAYFCHLCGKSFRMSSGLNRHIKELHYGLKKYPCDICGRFFASKNTRDDHMNIHTGARPFVCDQCGKSFKQKASLHVHKIFHKDDKPYECSTCGKTFRRKSDLKVHGYLHTGQRPHACDICGTSFRLSQDLKRHLKIHTKDYLVSCDKCGATFGQERYLKNHLKTHLKKEGQDPLALPDDVAVTENILIKSDL